MTTRRMCAALVVLLLGTSLLSACTGSDAVSQGSGNDYRFVSAQNLGRLIPVKDRKQAGKVSGTLLSGGKYQLSAQRGKVVVVNFWATWCGPCTTETPQFDQMYRDYLKARKPVTFVGIDTKDNAGKARLFVQNNAITYPILSDEQGASAVTLGKIPALALPFTVVIDQRGRVAAVYLNRLAPADLEPVVAKVLAGH